MNPHFQRVRVLDPAYPADVDGPFGTEPIAGRQPDVLPPGSCLLTPNESTTFCRYGHKSLGTYSLTEKGMGSQPSAANGRKWGLNGNRRQRSAGGQGVTSRTNGGTAGEPTGTLKTRLGKINQSVAVAWRVGQEICCGRNEDNVVPVRAHGVSAARCVAGNPNGGLVRHGYAHGAGNASTRGAKTRIPDENILTAASRKLVVGSQVRRNRAERYEP